MTAGVGACNFPQDGDDSLSLTAQADNARHRRTVGENRLSEF